MELSEVNKQIDRNFQYLVHFELIKDGILIADHFPNVEDGEEGFSNIKDAIKIGEKYAKATRGYTCNFYLIRSDNFTPVGNWKLKNR